MKVAQILVIGIAVKSALDVLCAVIRAPRPVGSYGAADALFGCLGLFVSIYALREMWWWPW